jgi:hypothetical protein
MTKATKFTLRQTAATKKPPAQPPAPPAPPDGEIEFGGPQGKEPTRYGDWEKNGRCSDF